MHAIYQTDIIFVLMSFFRTYLDNLFRASIPGPKIQQDAYNQITRALNRAFSLPSLQQYASTLTVKALLSKSVEMFVGSKAVPKNIQLAGAMLSMAGKKAKSLQQLNQTQYYRYVQVQIGICRYRQVYAILARNYFIKMQGQKQGDEQAFQFSSQAINKLAQQHRHPQASFMAGKQILRICQSQLDRQKRKQMLKTAIVYFQQSLNQYQYGGLFYIANILKTYQLMNISSEELHQLYIYGAALGNPLCYFQLSKTYTERNKNELALKYLKLAAQGGVVQAMHNLGCEYMQGILTPRDQVKAFAWFYHAAANGYRQSKLNVVEMLMYGSTCGRIKRNAKAALLKLQELKQYGQQVEERIRQLMESQQIKKELNEEEKQATVAKK